MSRIKSIFNVFSNENEMVGGNSQSRWSRTLDNIQQMTEEFFSRTEPQKLYATIVDAPGSTGDAINTENGPKQYQAARIRIEGSSDFMIPDPADLAERGFTNGEILNCMTMHPMAYSVGEIGGDEQQSAPPVQGDVVEVFREGNGWRFGKKVREDLRIKNLAIDRSVANQNSTSAGPAQSSFDSSTPTLSGDLPSINFEAATTIELGNPEAVIQDLQNLFTQKGYVWDPEFNLVGIRSLPQVNNKFTDYLVVTFVQNGVSRVYRMIMTTVPGYDRGQTIFYGTQGRAVMKEGQYIDAYGVGLHAGKYTALVNRDGKRYPDFFRDVNGDGILDISSPPSVLNENKLVGLNIHSTRFNSSPFSNVYNWSEGCQVIQWWQNFKHMMAIVNALGRKLYDYTLINSNDINIASYPFKNASSNGRITGAPEYEEL